MNEKNKKGLKGALDSEGARYAGELKFLRKDVKSLREDLGGLRSEFTEFRRENLNRLDKVMDILLRLDQERLFTFHAVTNIENDLEKQRQEIGKIKEILKI